MKKFNSAKIDALVTASDSGNLTLLRTQLEEPHTPGLWDYVWVGVHELHDDFSIISAFRRAVDHQRLEIINTWLREEPRLILWIDSYGPNFKKLLASIISKTVIRSDGALALAESDAGGSPTYTLEDIEFFLRFIINWGEDTSMPGGVDLLTYLYEANPEKLSSILIFYGSELYFKHLSNSHVFIEMIKNGDSERIISYLERIHSNGLEIGSYLFNQIIVKALEKRNYRVLEKVIELFPTLLQINEATDIIFHGTPRIDAVVAERIMRLYPSKYLSGLLQRAISEGRIEIADAALRVNAEIIAADPINLHYAAYYGHLPTVQLFITKGKPLNSYNVINNWEETPLMAAIRQGKYDVALAMIAAGADLGGNAIRHRYTTHYYTSTSGDGRGDGYLGSNSTPVTHSYVEHSVHKAETPFCLALNTGHAALLDAFYARKETMISGVKLIDYAGAHKSPLMYAIDGDISIAERLLREGAALDVTMEGKDPLTYAVESDNSDKIRTFFSFILTHCSYECINGLLIGEGPRGPKPARALIRSNAIYLDKVIERGDPTIVELLLIHGAAVTPAALAKAIHAGHLAVVQKMVAAGGDITQVDITTNKNAQSLARDLSKDEISTFFTQYLATKAEHEGENSATLVRRVMNPHRFFGERHLDIDTGGVTRLGMVG